MSYLEALIIAIIEGLTEFLPVSSTGHMVLTSAIMGIQPTAFTKLFEIVIQFAAILAVVVVYIKKFLNLRNISFYVKLLIACIPALAFGAVFKKHIDQMLEKPVIIAVIILAGGIILVFIDRFFKSPRIDSEEQITPKSSFIVGLFQVLSIIFPGLSRSAATIIGGMTQGLTRKAAAEFSFFVAVPTMFAASAKSLLDVYKESPEVLSSGNLGVLLFGCLISFLVAFLVVKFFIRFLEKHGFKVFGYYRIILGIAFLALCYVGIINAQFIS